MRVGKKIFRTNPKSTINIYFLGDVHVGNCNFAREEFKKAVNIIKDDPKGYWVGMGDYIDCIVTSDRKRFNPSAIDPLYKIQDLKNLPQVQIDDFYNMIKPIDSKCLALLHGNHEDKFTKHHDVDVFQMLMNKFVVKPLDMGYTGFLKLGYIVGQVDRERPHMVVVCVLNHGIGGGGYREGYGINKIHDVFRWTDADINIMGHIHQLLEDSKRIQGVSQTDKLKAKTKYWGCSGTFLRTFVEGQDNYFEHVGKFEAMIGMLKASICIDSSNSYRIELSKVVLG